jgi:hypothetical protein
MIINLKKTAQDMRQLRVDVTPNVTLDNQPLKYSFYIKHLTIHFKSGRGHHSLQAAL